RARAKRGGSKLSAQPAFERFCLCSNANHRGSEARRSGITRQGIPRPQTGRERRKIERISNAELTRLLTSIGRRGAVERASPDFVSRTWACNQCAQRACCPL